LYREIRSEVAGASLCRQFDSRRIGVKFPASLSNFSVTGGASARDAERINLVEFDGITTRLTSRYGRN